MFAIHWRHSTKWIFCWIFIGVFDKWRSDWKWLEWLVLSNVKLLGLRGFGSRFTSSVWVSSKFKYTHTTFKFLFLEMTEPILLKLTHIEFLRIWIEYLSINRTIWEHYALPVITKNKDLNVFGFIFGCVLYSSTN